VRYGMWDRAKGKRSVSPLWNRKSAFHGVNLRSAALEAEGKGKERCGMWGVGYEIEQRAKDLPLS
ncbi:MAG: hypothetical protein V3R28_03405, partial [Desulfatiglandales bacterium]